MDAEFDVEVIVVLPVVGVVVPVVEVVLPVVVFVVELCINTHCPFTRLYPVGQEVCLLMTIGMHP